MPKPQTHETLTLQSIRAQFPALQQTVHGKPLVYLDNAATTQKPKKVLDAIAHYYQHDNANVHRGIHTLASRATVALEASRTAVQRFIHAAEAAEIIFTGGTTASINLVATAYGQAQVQAGDEVIISHMEHHANIVPWQMLCQAKKATLKVIPINKLGELVLTALDRLLTSKTKIVAISYVSNTLGTINPLKEIIQKAHAKGAIVVVDGAQAIPHLPIDVQDLDCDFLAFSAHKAYGPTGVGVLYGKRTLLENMPPYQGGGEMIQKVTLTHTTYNDPPYKFEAGTPNIAGIIAWQEALRFITQVGYKHLMAHENALLTYALELLSSVKQVRIVGTAHRKIGILAFTIQNVHHLDAGMLLDAHGIAVRTGHSCTQPLMDFFDIEGVIRASFAIYNTKEEVEQFVATIARIAHKQLSNRP
ncbi:MAG: aminotransferase class V-fold PLP-dependent enzyme [Bacteroidota bacterium]